MSARPELATIPDAELDLLVSRAIDGDLSPDEERELAAYLAAHPEARARTAGMEALVARLKQLPAPEPPFALATRVSSQVSERSRGLGAVGHRFGLYIPPGLIAAGIGLLALGGILASFLAKAPSAERVAAVQKKDEGPVHVFFQDAPPAAAPRAAAPAPPKRADGPIATEVAGFDRKLEAMSGVRREASGEAAPAAPRLESRVASAEERAAAPAYAPEPAGIAAADETRARESAAPAPAPASAEPRIAMRESKPLAETLAAPEAGAARREKQRAARDFSIALVSGAGWRLTPPPPPPFAAPPTEATYRLVVDGGGRVARVVRGSRDVSPEMERFLSTLSFERLPDVAPAGEVEVRVVLR